MRERGLKSGHSFAANLRRIVAPVRERGLKCNHAVPRLKNLSRSREGAWIEIALSANYNLGEGVAPVRERGLKLLGVLLQMYLCYVAPVRERGLKFPAKERTVSCFWSLP